MNGRERNKLRRPSALDGCRPARSRSLRAGRLRQQPLARRVARSRTSIRSAMTESTPRHLDPTASYWSNDTLVTYQVYEPLVRLPLPEAAVRAGAEVGRRGGQADLPRQGRQQAARRRAGRTGGRERLRRTDQAGHQVPAASGLRQGRPGQVPLPLDEARRARRAAHADGLQGDRHARADRRRLRLRRQAPCDDAHHDADLRHLLGVRARPEGIRRPDQGRGQEAARRASTRRARTSPSSTSASGR